MGRMLIETALAQPDATITAAFDRADSPATGHDCAEFLGRSTGVTVVADLKSLAGADVLIDFTRPEATLTHLTACTAAGVNMVIGTTGFDQAGKDAIGAAAKKIAIVFAANMGWRQRHLKLLDRPAALNGIPSDHRDAPNTRSMRRRHSVEDGEVIADLAREVDHIAVYAREEIRRAQSWRDASPSSRR